MLWYSCDAIEYWKWTCGYMIKYIMLYDATNGLSSAKGRTIGTNGLWSESRYLDMWQRVVWWYVVW